MGHKKIRICTWRVVLNGGYGFDWRESIDTDLIDIIGSIHVDQIDTVFFNILSIRLMRWSVHVIPSILNDHLIWTDGEFNKNRPSRIKFEPRIEVWNFMPLTRRKGQGLTTASTFKIVYWYMIILARRSWDVLHLTAHFNSQERVQVL